MDPMYRFHQWAGESKNPRRGSLQDSAIRAAQLTLDGVIGGFSPANAYFEVRGIRMTFDTEEWPSRRCRGLEVYKSQGSSDMTMGSPSRRVSFRVSSHSQSPKTTANERKQRHSVRVIRTRDLFVITQAQSRRLSRRSAKQACDENATTRTPSSRVPRAGLGERHGCAATRGSGGPSPERTKRWR